MSAPRTQEFVERFERLAARRGDEPAWLAALRKAAFERFAAHGFPAAKLEDWKYTSTRELAQMRFEDGAPAAAGVSRAFVAEQLGPDFPGPVLAFVNGRFAASLSSLSALPAGVRAGSLAEALSSEPALLEPYLGRLAGFEEPSQAFVALSTAFLEDGAFVELSAGAAPAEPIGLVFATAANGAPAVAHPRLLVVAGAGSRATLVESHAGLGDGPYLANAVGEIALCDGAAVTHVKLQRDGAQAFHIATLQARQGRDARFTSCAISLGAALARSDVNARLDAEGAEAVLNGLFVAGAGQHVDTHTEIDHARPHGQSRELYKGILGGRARGVFNGKIIVRPDAQKTNAQQSNSNLLISDRARINTKPQLEIFADDVKCSHGSTVGHLDEQALFYLRSRGIAAGAAREILTRAFASEITEEIPVPGLRARVDALLLERLGGGDQPEAT